MFVLIAYDVNITSPSGAKRLRKVAKSCQNYGTRVQNSLFECALTEAQFVGLRHELEQIIDNEKDSIRFYSLGTNWDRKVITIGKSTAIDVTGDLIV